MRFFSHWQNDVLMVGVIGVLMSMIWEYGGGVNIENNEHLQTYGGSLPKSTLETITHMQGNLEQAQSIVEASKECLHFKDDNFQDHYYKYAYHGLWYNKQLIVSSIQSFSFEYRDRAGNLVTRYPKVYPEIQQIGFTFHMNINGKSVSTHHKITLDHKTKLPIQLVYQ